MVRVCSALFICRYFVDDEVLDRVPDLFLLLGAIWGAMELLTLPFIRDPTEDELTELQQVHLIMFPEKFSYLIHTFYHDFPKAILNKRTWCGWRTGWKICQTKNIQSFNQASNEDWIVLEALVIQGIFKQLPLSFIF